jgi:hypothetical protein
VELHHEILTTQNVLNLNRNFYLIAKIKKYFYMTASILWTYYGMGRNTKKNPIKIRLSIKVGKILIPLYLGISISHTKFVGILHKENFTRKIKENYLSKFYPYLFTNKRSQDAKKGVFGLLNVEPILISNFLLFSL